MTILKPKLSRRKIKPAKPIIINKSQVSNFSKTLLSKPKEPLFEGKYSKRLTKKMPRKKIKPIKPVIYNKPYLSDYDTRLIKFKHAFENKYGFNIFKTKGEKLHVFLPMTGMSPQGYLLKAFFEQTLPKARVTFLVTPKSALVEADPEFRRKALNNLENHLRRSLNIHDKYFVCFDYIQKGSVQINIMQILNKIYNKEVNYFAVKSPRDRGIPTHIKEPDGSSIRPLQSKAKFKNIIQEHYNAGIELSRMKNFISKLLE